MLELMASVLMMLFHLHLFQKSFTLDISVVMFGILVEIGSLSGKISASQATVRENFQVVMISCVRSNYNHRIVMSVHVAQSVVAYKKQEKHVSN